jgi:hypothetical protein
MFFLPQKVQYKGEIRANFLTDQERKLSLSLLSQDYLHLRSIPDIPAPEDKENA